MRDAEYRTAFVASQINIGIPFQLRALLKGRGKTQEWLAEKTGMLQPRISGLLNPGKTRPNIETLRRLAEAFDCGLAVRFVPFSELMSWSDRFDPESFNIPRFEEDQELSERNTADMKAIDAYIQETLRMAAARQGPRMVSPGACLQNNLSGVVMAPKPPEPQSAQPEIETSRAGLELVSIKGGRKKQNGRGRKDSERAA